MRKTSWLVLGGALLLAGAGCATPPASNANIPTAKTEKNTLSEAAPTDSAAAPAEKTFSMTAKQWEFSPGTITVNKGDSVTFNIRSTDVAHGFVLPQFKVNAILSPGETTVVRFTADQAGTFDFRCSVFCGDGHAGMKGTLIVKE